LKRPSANAINKVLSQRVEAHARGGVFKNGFQIPGRQRLAAAMNFNLFPDPVASAADGFPMDGLPLPFLRELINDNGGESAFEDMTTSNVKRSIIVPLTQATKLSLCAQLKQSGDARVQRATWFVSHAWQMKFCDLVKALEFLFADEPGAVIWLDLFSTSQHSTFDKPPEWWQQTFCPAIGRMGQMVMVMTPWDNPVTLTPPGA
jgi:hypothetical protein